MNETHNFKEGDKFRCASSPDWYYELLSALPDDDNCYPFRRRCIAGGWTEYCTDAMQHMTIMPPEPPSCLAGYWVNVNDDYSNGSLRTAADADDSRFNNRIGRFKLDMSSFVADESWVAQQRSQS